MKIYCFLILALFIACSKTEKTPTEVVFLSEETEKNRIRYLDYKNSWSLEFHLYPPNHQYHRQPNYSSTYDFGFHKFHWNQGFAIIPISYSATYGKSPGSFSFVTQPTKYKMYKKEKELITEVDLRIIAIDTSKLFRYVPHENEKCIVEDLEQGLMDLSNAAKDTISVIHYINDIEWQTDLICSYNQKVVVENKSNEITVRFKKQGTTDCIPFLQKRFFKWKTLYLKEVFNAKKRVYDKTDFEEMQYIDQPLKLWHDQKEYFNLKKEMCENGNHRSERIFKE